MCELCPYALVCKVHGDVMVCAWSPALTLRGFCVMSSKLVDSKLSFMATYRRRPSSSGNRECRSPATRGSVSRRPFWISSVEKDMKDKTINTWKCAKKKSWSMSQVWINTQRFDISMQLSDAALKTHDTSMQCLIGPIDRSVTSSCCELSHSGEKGSGLHYQREFDHRGIYVYSHCTSISCLSVSEKNCF